MSLVYTIQLQDLASRGLEGIAQGTIKVNRASMQYSGIIGELNKKMDTLKSKRERAFNERDITKYNLEIRKTQRELQRLESLPPKTFMQRMVDLPSIAKRAAVGMAGIFAVTQVNRFLGEVRDVRAEFQAMDTSIRFASAGEGEKNLGFIRSEANRLGLDLKSAREGFLTLAGATRGSALQGEATREIFTGVATASTAMGLSADQSKGALLAISQIMSKGKVQAEELQGQLAERIPGAFGIAARSMGVTEAQLNKMLDNGELLATEFLPRFTAELKSTFNAGAIANAQGLNAEINKQNSAYYEMQATLGQLLEPAYLRIIKIKRELTSTAINLVNWLRENKDVIGSITAALAAGATTWAVYSGIVKITGTYTAILNAYQKAQAATTGTLTFAQWALNAAMTANPIGIVVAGVAALAGGLYWLFENVEQVRGAFTGFYEGAKAAFLGIWDVGKNILGGIGNIIMGIFNWDSEQIKSGLGSLAKGAAAANPVGFMYQYGKQIGEASVKGYNEGVVKFRQEQKAEKLEGMDWTKVAYKDVQKHAAAGVVSAKQELDRRAMGGATSILGAGPNGGPAAPGASNLQAGIAGVSGDKNAARNITINIEKIVGIEKVLSDNAKEVVRQLKGQITRVILDDINGLNTAG